ncbi:FtsJ-like methyltransferase-domain-containing protein [Biscogniauxia marginata]|nr:FtsJ-like methyltransferase-domain-containing protein [Biscogniauxia marginata]
MQALLRIATPRNGRLVRTVAPAAVRLLVASHTLASTPALVTRERARWASSWKQRQDSDPYARQAKVQGFKSRAAFKLLEIDSKYSIFRRGQTVVDLGYAPGSWSQVAVERTRPHGRVVGIDLIPAQPPKGVSTIQGNFLSPGVQNLVKEYLMEFAKPGNENSPWDDSEGVISERPSYIDTERAESAEDLKASEREGKIVDLVLSDMSEPWPQTAGFSVMTMNNAYHRSRMMNTSGNSLRDHTGSMDLCRAALQFASDTLRPDGHFVCKFYQGGDDKELEQKLKKMFAKVHREKPSSSRSESREAYFIALRRKGNVILADT